MLITCRLTTELAGQSPLAVVSFEAHRCYYQSAWPDDPIHQLRQLVCCTLAAVVETVVPLEIAPVDTIACVQPQLTARHATALIAQGVTSLQVCTTDS